MKRLIITLQVLFVLAAAGMPLTWWLARPAPPIVRYQYASFRWPAGVESAAFDFQPGDVFTNAYDIMCSSGRLDRVLTEARESTGFDYFRAVGDTVILRRVAPASPDDPLASRTNLWVVPNPPGPHDPNDIFRIIGHVKIPNQKPPPRGKVTKHRPQHPPAA